MPFITSLGKTNAAIKDNNIRVDNIVNNSTGMFSNTIDFMTS